MSEKAANDQTKKVKNWCSRPQKKINKKKIIKLTKRISKKARKSVSLELTYK